MFPSLSNFSQTPKHFIRVQQVGNHWSRALCRSFALYNAVSCSFRCWISIHIHCRNQRHLPRSKRTRFKIFSPELGFLIWLKPAFIDLVTLQNDCAWFIFIFVVVMWWEIQQAVGIFLYKLQLFISYQTVVCANNTDTLLVLWILFKIS